MSSSASDYQKKVFNTLSSIGCSRVNITRANNNSFALNYVSGWRLIIYLVCHINFVIKVSFVLLLSCGLFGFVLEFFDYIAILLWLLIIGMILTSERLFYRKFPFYEILCAGWAIQDDMYKRLGSSMGLDFKEKLREIAKSRVILQSWIAAVGSAAMMVQYIAAPKYVVFTYAIVEEDSTFFMTLCGAHELLFIFHGWQFYGGIIYVSSCIGAELTHCIKILTQAIISLQNNEILDENENLEHENFGSSSANSDKKSLPKYSIESIIADYKKLIIFSDRVNAYASYNFLIIHFLAYCQMISDVFVMIQLLRMPETDLMGVFFFLEDCLVCMYMLFKVFKSMAFVKEESDTFLSEFRFYLASRKNYAGVLLRKEYRSLRTISMRIGPSFIGRSMVGTAMMNLMNYYVCVAMW